jgi:hypothetical protein
MYFNRTKAIYDKPIINIILNGEKLKVLLVKSEKRQRCSLFPLLFDIVFESLARTIRQEKEIKGIQTGNEEVKTSIFADDMILYFKDPKDATKNLLDKVAEYKINI